MVVDDPDVEQAASACSCEGTTDGDSGIVSNGGESSIVQYPARVYDFIRHLITRTRGRTAPDPVPVCTLLSPDMAVLSPAEA